MSIASDPSLPPVRGVRWLKALCVFTTGVSVMSIPPLDPPVETPLAEESANEDWPCCGKVQVHASTRPT